MIKHLTKRRAAATLALALGGVVVGATAAAAATTPYTDSQSFGGFKVYNTAGQQELTFPSNQPLTSVIGKFVADTASPAGYKGDDDSASIYAAQVSVWSPQTTTPDNWSGAPLGVTKIQSTPAQPAVVPLTNEPRSFETIASIEAAPAFAGYYELRLTPTNDDLGPSVNSYFTIDVTLDTTAHTVTIVREGAVEPPPAVTAALPEASIALLLPLTAVALGGGIVVMRRRRASDMAA